jgi:hypothetical protein
VVSKIVDRAVDKTDSRGVCSRVGIDTGRDDEWRHLAETFKREVDSLCVNEHHFPSAFAIQFTQTSVPPDVETAQQ